MASIFARLKTKKFALNLTNSINKKQSRYRKIIQDAIYLGSDGWTFDARKETFSKNIEVKGLFPGKYLVKITFPGHYPLIPPKFIVNPIDRDDSYCSTHLFHHGYVCIADPEWDGDGKTKHWWRSDVNMQAALIILKQIMRGNWDGFSSTYGYKFVEDEYINLVNNLKKKAGIDINYLITWFNAQDITVCNYGTHINLRMARFIQELPDNYKKRVYSFYDSKRKEYANKKDTKKSGKSSGKNAGSSGRSRGKRSVSKEGLQGSAEAQVFS